MLSELKNIDMYNKKKLWGSSAVSLSYCCQKKMKYILFIS